MVGTDWLPIINTRLQPLSMSANKVVGEFGVEPFTEGYEGEAYHDLTGRMNDST